MFNKRYNERLVEWRSFREQTLSKSTDIIADVINFYQQAPTVRINTDPYNQSIWLGPWELLLENKYCKFCKILGMCYTLQLTESFKGEDYKIHIGKDWENHEIYYLLSIDDSIIVFDDNYIRVRDLPENIVIERNYFMPHIH